MFVTPRYRRVIVFLIQLGLVAASYVSSFVLRFDLDVDLVPWDVVGKTLPLLILVRMGPLWFFRLYQGIWRYVSVGDLIEILKATTVGSIAFIVLLVPIFGLQEFPRAVLLLDWAGTIFLLSGVRLSIRIFRERFGEAANINREFKRLLIVGAGDAGAALCAQVLRNPAFGFKPVTFVDDDSRKVGNTIQRVPVAGQIKDISRVVVEYRVDSIVIAIPSATSQEMRHLVDVCQQAQVPFKILPHTLDILGGTVRLSHIREVDPVDLLGRPPAKLDRKAIQAFINGKRILITGAAGSVGSELARQIVALEPELLVLVDNAESPLFLLEAEIRADFPGASVTARVADVAGLGGASAVMTNKPQVVYHAAAYKHVPMMEAASAEAVRNNVGGTYVMAQCSIDAGVETFILVSTDKAVNPTSVMGATKRLAELMIQEINVAESTQFKTVRFGNVIGSNASVVPIFKNQIARGGPVTVTHRDATRYFMSLPEAAGLILQASAVGAGGQIFVLDMGDPIRIIAIAETLITLSGFKPNDDVDIVFTGLRPGEKLTEQLNYKEENFQSTGYEKLLMMRTGSPDRKVLSGVEGLLRTLPDLDAAEVKKSLQRLVPEYQPNTLIDTFAGHSGFDGGE